MPYLKTKGLLSGQNPKTERERYLLPAEVSRILAAIQADAVGNPPRNPDWRRDHAAVFLGYYLGLRIGEAVLLERQHFRDVGKGVIYVPTLKSGIRLRVVCRGCGKTQTVAADRSGEHYKCSKCGTATAVKAPTKTTPSGPVEKVPAVIESSVLRYAKAYLTVLPDKRWLLYSNVGDDHLRVRQLNNIFGTYVVRAKLSLKYSWHALRHGRGVALWASTRDQVVVRDGLRQRSLNSTARYVHLDPIRRRRLEEGMDRQVIGFKTN